MAFTMSAVERSSMFSIKFPRKGWLSAKYLWKLSMWVLVLWLVRFPARSMPERFEVHEKGTSMTGLPDPSFTFLMGGATSQPPCGIAMHDVDTAKLVALKSSSGSASAGPMMAYWTLSGFAKLKVVCLSDTKFFISWMIVALVGAREVALLFGAACAVIAHPQRLVGPRGPFSGLLAHQGAISLLYCLDSGESSWTCTSSTASAAAWKYTSAAWMRKLEYVSPGCSSVSTQSSR